MEMQGRIREGIDFLTSRERDWADNNGLAFHNWWHLGLFHLDAGNVSQVLDLYDRRIRPAPSQVPLEMLDGSAMLWRLQLRGHRGRRPVARAGELLGAVCRARLLRVQRRACGDGIRRGAANGSCAADDRGDGSEDAPARIPTP